jgi:hypothetical protein
VRRKSWQLVTDVDPEVALKDSRDPLGFQPIWSHFGRKLVGNLTTVTTSVRGFTTLLLGHHFASRLVDGGGVPAAEYIEPFLRFEQIAAYSRIAWAEETGDAVGTRKQRCALWPRTMTKSAAAPEPLSTKGSKRHSPKPPLRLPRAFLNPERASTRVHSSPN